MGEALYEAREEAVVAVVKGGIIAFEKERVRIKTSERLAVYRKKENRFIIVSS